MASIQEYLNKQYPTREEKEAVREIRLDEVNKEREKQGVGKLDGGELDLSDFPNLWRLYAYNCSLTKLTLNNCICLKRLYLTGNKLTSLDFLMELPNPKELEWLIICDNNIKSTNISFFEPFTNLIRLKLGTAGRGLGEGKNNQFYGSLKSYRKMTKLEKICIEATDINEGLEYLPLSLAKETKNGYAIGRSGSFECFPHGTTAKCSQIQDQLRPFNYDLEAWQLAHPQKIYQVRPEIFFNSDTKTEWINALRDKTSETQTKLNELKTNEPDKVKKIKRLETKLYNLELIRDNISNHRLIERLETKKGMVNKETQTDLTGNKIKEMEGVIEQLRQIQLPKK